MGLFNFFNKSKEIRIYMLLITGKQTTWLLKKDNFTI